MNTLFTKYDLNEKVLFLFVSIILVSCAPGMTSVIYGDNYNVKDDITSITILPYGSVEIPGKWIKTSENKVSHQHFFIGSDSVTFAVALNHWNNYEFFTPELTPENFVRAFYEWDSNYLKEQINGQVRIIKEDKEKNFIVWNLSNQKLNEYFLFGLKGKVAFSLYIGSDVWNEAKQIKILEDIYLH